jgi:hypothetical protein
MCSSDAPKRQALTPEAPVTPAPSTTTTSDADRRRRAAAAGGTILTSSRGTTETGTTATKTLLGQ